MKNEIKRGVVRTQLVLSAFSLAILTTAGFEMLPASAQKTAPIKSALPQSAITDLMWSTDLDSTLAQAKTQKKYVLADVYTDWCLWCKRLDRDTFQNPGMMSYLKKKYMTVKINAERPNGGKEAAEKYKVYEFPCILVFEPSGKLLGKIMGYHKPAEFQKALEDLIQHPPSDPYAS
jgi:thiol:disulfide interchange protein